MVPKHVLRKAGSLDSIDAATCRFEGGVVRGLWVELSAGRVVRLVGASPEAVALSLEPLPDGAPAVVTCRPRVETSPTRAVAAILDQLETAVIDLYPAWLPGAEAIEGPEGAGVAAVRALARDLASATPHFGLFLADLAERSLRGGTPANGMRGDRTRGNGRYAAEVRAAGLARVVAASFGRPHAALLVQVPGQLAPAAEESLLTACDWLAQHGGLAVGLTGAEVRTADRVRAVTVRLPAHVASLAGPDLPEARRPAPEPAAPEPAAVGFPAPAGRPHPASRAEQALEVALAAQLWAHGRAWNETYRPDALAPEIRVDLIWAEERCAVEIDGPEHRGVLHYEADRRRDVLLQLAGFAVLRFTNGQVLSDIAAVLSQIEQLITTRRFGKD